MDQSEEIILQRSRLIQTLQQSLMKQMNNLHTIMQRNRKITHLTPEIAQKMIQFKNQLTQFKNIFLNAKQSIYWQIQQALKVLSYPTKSQSLLKQKLQEKTTQNFQLSQAIQKMRRNYISLQEKINQVIQNQMKVKQQQTSRIAQLQSWLNSCTCKYQQNLSPKHIKLDTITQQECSISRSKSFMNIQQDSMYNSISYIKGKTYQSEQQCQLSSEQLRHWNSIISQTPKINAIEFQNRIMPFIQRPIQTKQNKDAKNISNNPLFKKKMKIIPQPTAQQVLGLGLNSFSLKQYQLKYEGQTTGGMKNGRGNLKYARGLYYQGQFLNNRRHGYGMLKLQNIEIYNGDWQKDCFHGQGRLRNSRNLVLKNKRKGLQGWISYYGQFRDNLFHGRGTLIFQNGQKYIGGFQNGLANGQGSIIKKNGIHQHSIWHRGILSTIL